MARIQVRNGRIQASNTTLNLHLYGAIDVHLAETTTCLSIDTDSAQLNLFAGSLSEIEQLAHAILLVVDERRGRLDEPNLLTSPPPTKDELEAIRRDYATISHAW